MTNNQLTRERLEKIKSWRETYGAGSNVMLPAEEAEELARMVLAAMDSDPNRNPVLAYADSYRDMAKQGVESVQIWSVITDLERNIAPLYRHAQPAPGVPGVPDFKKLARELVDNLVDCGGLDEGVKEKYLEWAEKTCRAAMLAAAPHEVQVVPEKIEQSRKRVDRCDVCTEGARGGCGTCIFNGNFE
ncbi:DUF550 domain-containing protein [Klebsiella pneumoniae]|uniref:DUF550 domain-containing protein n=1 Tax=Klebsiella pneumoniae TaxID=573 RepID=UPI000E2B1B4B|nr:DUF550 domain-containing protein [Klebsiella pneumoniae]SWL28950.1 Uncharacterised protein [Klebsiella pneumoniae]